MKNSFCLGKRLRQFRNESGLSQEQLAHKANITPAYLGQVERGMKHITDKTLEKVCDALNISLLEFFDTEADGEIDEITRQMIWLLRSQDEEKKILEIVRLYLSLAQE